MKSDKIDEINLPNDPEFRSAFVAYNSDITCLQGINGYF